MPTTIAATTAAITIQRAWPDPAPWGLVGWLRDGMVASYVLYLDLRAGGMCG